MTRLDRILPLLMAGLLVFLSACSNDELSAVPDPAATPEGRWQQDVQYVFDNVARLHPDAFHRVEREAFERAAQELIDETERGSDQALVLGMARVMALLGDKQATVEFEPARFPALPVELMSASDGFFVVAAPAGEAAALGGRLLSVGGVPLAEALARLGGVISHENEYGLRDRAAQVLRLPGALQILGLSESRSAARWELESATGPRALELMLVPGGEERSMLRVDRAAGTVADEKPERYYWHRFLPSEGTMYWQVDRCEEDPEQPFGDYAAKFLAELDGPAVKRLVLDLRWNQVGKESVARKVYLAMKGHRLNVPGGIMVLVGPGTAGSAQSLALNLRERTAATLIGRPLGQRENTYGEARRFLSPNHRVPVSYPTKYYARGSDQADSVQPDVLVPLLFEDWREGLDRALEAALAGGA